MQIRKKLRGIEALKLKTALGEELNEEQVAKLESEAELDAERKNLEARFGPPEEQVRQLETEEPEASGTEAEAGEFWGAPLPPAEEAPSPKEETPPRTPSPRRAADSEAVAVEEDHGWTTQKRRGTPKDVFRAAEKARGRPSTKQLASKYMFQAPPQDLAEDPTQDEEAAVPPAAKPTPAPPGGAAGSHSEGGGGKDPRDAARDAALAALAPAWRAGAFAQQHLEAHRAAVSCVFVAGARIMTGSVDSTVKEWALASGELLRCVGGHTNAVRGLWGDSAVSLSASDDSMVLKWCAESGRRLRGLYCFAPVRCIAAIALDGCLLALTGHSDATVRTYDLSDGGADEPRCKLRGHRAAVTAVSAAPGPSGAGAWAVSASEDGTVRVWDTDKREAVHVVEHPGGGVPRGVRWRADAGELVAAADDGALLLWTAPFGRRPVDIAAAARGGAGHSGAGEGRGCVHFAGGVAVCASHVAQGAGALDVFLWATRERLYTVTPEDMDAVGAIHGRTGTLVVGGLDGFVTVLRAGERGEGGNGCALARVAFPAARNKTRRGGGSAKRAAAAESKGERGAGPAEPSAGGAAESASAQLGASVQCAVGAALAVAVAAVGIAVGMGMSE